MITIYTIAYNEAFFLPYFFAHYLSRFPGARIIVYDNESTDNTADIARAFGAEVRTYSTGGKLSDQAYLDIKNNCWKDAVTDWVLICDVDELCDIEAHEVLFESDNKSDICIFEGYNMVNMKNSMDVHAIEEGVRASSYDKTYCFNRTSIKEINYGPGSHKASPVPYIGQVITSDNYYICRHYKYVNPDYMIARHANFSARLSDDNLQRGWGYHYNFSSDKIREEFETARKNAIKIL